MMASRAPRIIATPLKRYNVVEDKVHDLLAGEGPALTGIHL
jgi:hypothetical protein